MCLALVLCQDVNRHERTAIFSWTGLDTYVNWTVRGNYLQIWLLDPMKLNTIKTKNTRIIHHESSRFARKLVNTEFQISSKSSIQSVSLLRVTGSKVQMKNQWKSNSLCRTGKPQNWSLLAPRWGPPIMNPCKCILMDKKSSWTNLKFTWSQ